MGDLKKKVLYSLILTGSRFLFPILTYPYISRVLGPGKIGLLNFSETYANYFVLLAALGIPLYGVREIAKVTNDRQHLNKTFTEISVIYFFTTVGCTIIYACSLYFIPQLRNESTLNILFGLNIIMNFISFEWFFIGIEKFKFITNRSLVTKLIPIVLMFVFVKNEGDYIIYQVFNLLAFLANSIVNLIALRKYVNFDFTGLHVFRHLRPTIVVFFGSVFISFYSMVDTVMLGFLSTEKSVGFYSVAIKLNRIASLVVASIGNVLVPRISFLKSTGDHSVIGETIHKSMRFTIALTIPLSMAFFLLSEHIILILAGEEFRNSITPFQILAPIVILLGISNIFSIQILLPFSRETDLLKIFLFSTICALIFNFILIPRFDYTGATIATLLTEVCITVMSGYFAFRVMKIEFPYKVLIHCTIASLLFIPVHFALMHVFENIWIEISVALTAFGLIYVLSQVFIFKNSDFILLIEKGLQKLRNA